MKVEPGTSGAEHPETVNGISELVERDFRCRGNVTVWREEGGPVTSYLFNRNNRASEPFVQLFETETGRDICIPYKGITQFLFTGSDAASASIRHFENFNMGQEGTFRGGPAENPRGGQGLGD